MKFKPDDFGTDFRAHQASKLANAKLDEWLKDAPVVYGQEQWKGAMWSQINENTDTHKARLVCIEKLHEKE